MHFSLNAELSAPAAAEEKEGLPQVPRDHPFTMHSVGGQTLAVFSQSNTGQTAAQLNSTLTLFSFKTLLKKHLAESSRLQTGIL